MDNGTLVAANHHIHARHPGLRRASVVAALAIILSLFILVQEPANAAPGGGAVASVALPGIGAGASPQIEQIVCPILLEFRATFAGQPFFAVAVPIIDQLLISFGCIPGPTTTTTLAPTTTTTTVAPTTTTTVTFPPIPGINFGQIACPILLSVRASFENSPFFSGFLPVIDQLIVSFGCVISG